ncbi:TSC complex subunit 1a [Betta splendens]|uniref:TSC complex subunit 1a n=1 Tax=Betta splendens TaxID=158456 RepID=A0A9W2Y0C4_BETSP|nr:TSC complex subunit 1a [Betta splendens]
MDLSYFGGPTPPDELQSVRSQLLLVHGQLQYERFKRQQHAIRNRRLLRRVINTMALEEQNVAMKAQLGVQDQEIQSLKSSLQTEQGQYTKLQQDTDKHTKELQTCIQKLLLQLQDEQRRNQRLQDELQECQSGLRDLEAELQRAHNQAYYSKHQLTQLSLKLCSSEQLQQHIFVLNQQLLLLREANRALTEQLDGGDDHCTEASMLQCSVSKDYQRLKDNGVLHRQKLEAANHRITELEDQVAKKDELILDQKKLLDDTKTQSRAELLACECRCLALRRVIQSLQTEMLHLYTQVCLDTHGRPQDVCTRSNGDSSISPVIQDGPKPNLYSSSSAGIINGEAEALSSSPIESPLAIGSFLEQRSRQLFRATIHSQNEEKMGQEEEKEQEYKPQSPLPPQEVEEATLITGSPKAEHPNQTPDPSLPASDPLSRHADLNLDGRQRRCELSIMDYDETLPEN